MLSIISGLLHNVVFMASITAWFVAQSLKVVFSLFPPGRGIDFRRFVASGGMPSSHTAFVTALATIIGLEQGWDSPLTGIALALALVVMYDAAGVRRAAGKQAQVLNKMIEELYVEGHFHHERLRELIGHSPIEVLGGAILGIAVAFLFH